MPLWIQLLWVVILVLYGISTRGILQIILSVIFGGILFGALYKVSMFLAGVGSATSGSQPGYEFVKAVMMVAWISAAIYVPIAITKWIWLLKKKHPGTDPASHHIIPQLPS